MRWAVIWLTTMTCMGVAMAEGSERPNILFLLADDLRHDLVGFMGHDIVETPALDALAEEGTVFEQAFVTTSICAISRASILAGQYAARHGIDDFGKTFSDEAFAQTYPALLREAGYYTGFIGKWGVGNVMPEDQFDYWKGFPGQGHFYVETEEGMQHLESVMADQALAFLDEAPDEKPWCLSVSFKAPHVQDQDPKQYLYDPALEDLYADVTIPEPHLGDPEYFAQWPEFIQNSENRVRWEKRFSTPEKYQASVKGYYRLVTGIDRAVARMVKALEAAGMRDNTIIVFTSDHGIFNGERGLAGKWLMHEESIRIPLLIVDPRLPESFHGERRPDMVLNIDMAPTILAWAGIDAPEAMQGLNLTPILRGAKMILREDLFYEHHFGNDRPAPIPANEGVRTTEWKYIRYLEREPLVEELYHLVEDPGETRNLARDPEYQARLEEMQARWQAFQERVR